MYSSYDFVISDGVLTALHVGANAGGGANHPGRRNHADS